MASSGKLFIHLSQRRQAWRRQGKVDNCAHGARFQGNGTVLHERYKGRFPEPEG